jgi:uncharacterized protein YecT (DUF1311 family)
MPNARTLAFTPLVLALLTAACGDRQAQAEAEAAAAPVRSQPVTQPTDPAPAPDAAPPPSAESAAVATDAPAQASTLEQTLEQAPLRPGFRACIVASGGATPAMQDCIAEEYRHQDGRLNAAYRNLRGALPKAQADAVRTEQRAWLTQRDSVCAWDAATQGQAQRLAANECLLRMTAVRASELEQAVSDDR